MATDIYKLVQQQLAESQPGRNQFYDPMADIIMQIPQMIQAKKDAETVANKDALVNISSLIDKINTPEGFANISASLDTLSNESGGNVELDTNIAILQGINKTNQENYRTYKQGVDRGLEYVDSDSFPKDMKSYQNLGEIALNSGFKNEDGTGNQLEYLYAEKEKINAIMDKLSLGSDGKTQKFSYGKGTDRMVLRKLQEHNNQIDIAVKTLAGDGIITKDEAYHIMSGDSKFYVEDKKAAMDEARDILKSGMSTDRSLGKLLSKQSLDDDDHDLLAGYDIDSKGLEATPGGRETINNYITSAMKLNKQRMQINNQKYRDWAGRDYDPSLRMGEPQYSDFSIDEETSIYDDPEGVSEETESIELGQNLRHPPTNIEEESEGMSWEAYNSPVFQKKIDNINKIKSDLNKFNEIGTPTSHPIGFSTGSRGTSSFIKKPRTEKNQMEQLLDLDLGEKVSIDKIYNLRDKTLPAWKNRKTQIESRVNAIVELYPKANAMLKIEGRKPIIPDNVPYDIREELKNLKEEWSALHRKTKQGNRFFKRTIGGYGDIQGYRIIKNYEKSINKLKQAENNLETFKATHKSK